MITPALICLILALVLFAIAAFGVSGGRFNLLAAGLFFGTLSLLMPYFK